MSIIFESEEERIASEYFDTINDLIGMVALALAYTALQFEHPKPFAVLALVPTLLWSFSKGAKYKKIVNYYLPKGTPIIVYLRIAWRIKVYVFGVTFLTTIAIGIVDKPFIYKVFGYAAVPYPLFHRVCAKSRAGWRIQTLSVSRECFE
ncbi:hypothetical protein ABHF54_13105 [Nitrosomonas europaea]|uniref:hypothetical protein n=1 Tax=Nitrosomonas europaea TaxID=915 RepID=UPI003266ECF3